MLFQPNSNDELETIARENPRKFALLPTVAS